VTPSRPAAEFLYQDDKPLAMFARNVSTTYVALIVDSVLGLLMLPFNVSHLGTSAYGLWVLTASVTVHFSILDLGYGSALVKFIARYRAHRDPKALNEIASTVFFLFAICGCLAYLVAAIVAFNLGFFFKVTPEQAALGKWVLLVIGVPVALNFPFSVFGGIVVGFQRQHLNGVVAIIVSTLVVTANVAVLMSGFGLVALVLATTTVRVLAYGVYASNAYRVFPALRLRPSLFRRDRLKEVTSFSVFSSLIDWAAKLNYQADQLVIGAVMGPALVAVWAVADRVIVGTQNLTNQLNGQLFPFIVDSDASDREERLQQILVQGTRLSLATVLPIAVVLFTLADPLIRAWVGHRKPELLGSVPVLQILAAVVATRVGSGTAMTLLKGAGRHRMLAAVNIATGIVNVVISVVLARIIGLPGVAWGTLIPVALASLFIIEPAACQRVGLSCRALILRSVVPAVWPAVVIAGVLVATRPLDATLVGVGIRMVLAGLLYVALFAAAIGGQERRLYFHKAKEVLGYRTPERALPVAQAAIKPADPIATGT
jgi:O-antigen/teichoic acid export membrane protein